MSGSLTTLRVITQRLTTTPTWQLPRVAPYLASIVISCETIFADLECQSQTKNDSEAAFLVHKFKTQISALLLDKNPQSRWAAIILIKAVVEIGGWNVLHGCGPWVRGLLGILGKPDPQPTKELCIITLTRIFMLLDDHQSLVREIVTPSLPGFITSCICITENQQSPAEGRKVVRGNLVPVILYALCELLPRHPTLFRPFISPIRLLILPLIASTPSSYEMESPSNHQLADGILSFNSVAEPSRKLHVLLSICASKNTSSDEWAKSMHNTISMLHCTADRVFRAVVEDWDSTSSRVELNLRPLLDFAETVSDFEDNSLGLPGWKGIGAGMERLDGLLHVIQGFLTNTTPGTVTFPVGIVFDIVNRILSVFPPLDDGKDGNSGNMRIKPEIGRDEREGLWTSLPNLHVTALEVLSLIISRFGDACAALSQSVLEQALWVFEREKNNHNVRKIVYKVVSNILSLFGLAVSKSVSPFLSNCIRACCEDLLPSKELPLPAAVNSPSSTKKSSTNGITMNADSYLQIHSKFSKLSPDALSETQKSAALLLPLTLTKLPSGFIHSSLRTQIERTAILTRNKQATLASILGPSANHGAKAKSSSIMPMFARQFSDSLEAEALIRPRMPILQPRRTYREDLSAEEDDEIPGYQNHGHKAPAEYSNNAEVPKSNPPKITSPSINPTIQESNTSESNTTTIHTYTHPTQEPSSAQSLTLSQKRDREPSPVNPSIPPSSPKESLNPLQNKRQRIEAPYTGNAPAPSLSEYPRLETYGEEGSDESDFEMPILDPTMDTEDEEDEEDEEKEERGRG